MARSPRKGRSTSKGRSASAKKTPAKKAAPKASHDMEFEEGDHVMALWPGTSLYFKAKVTFVRDDDNEYDVQYEDGTIFTIKARDVRKNIAKAAQGKKTPSRSRSRGRSPARKKTSSSSSRQPNRCASSVSLTIKARSSWVGSRSSGITFS